MTHEQMMRLALASIVGPPFFVLHHLEQKHGRLDLADLLALDGDEGKAVWNAMPREFMVRVANYLDVNEVAEMLGSERMAKVHEAVADFLRTEPRAKQ